MQQYNFPTAIRKAKTKAERTDILKIWSDFLAESEKDDAAYAIRWMIKNKKFPEWRADVKQYFWVVESEWWRDKEARLQSEMMPSHHTEVGGFTFYQAVKYIAKRLIILREMIEA